MHQPIHSYTHSAATLKVAIDDETQTTTLVQCNNKMNDEHFALLS